MGATSSPSAEYPWLKIYPKEVDWYEKFEAAPLFKLLEDTAKKYPNRSAIDFMGKKYTYAEMQCLVNRVAKGLQDLDVKKGTHVGLFMPNAAVYPIFYYGILKAGGVVVNFSPLYAPREIATQIEDSKTEVMVTLDLEALYSKLATMLDRTTLQKLIICPLKDQLPFPKNILFPLLRAKDIAKIKWNRRHISFNELIDNDGQPKPVEIDPTEDVAIIQYTGGTTGLPKGAMLTHANVYINTNQAERWFIRDKEEYEKGLAALPCFHVFAMTAVMNLAVILGAEIVMMFPKFNADDAMKLIQKHKITFFPGVPTIYSLIANHPKVHKFNLRSIKACLSGGAPLPRSVKRQFEDITGCKLVEAYGLSETSPAVTCNPLYGENKEGSIGIPFPGTIVKIMSLDDPLKEVPLGEKGEICVAGPQIMKGYWNRPAETAYCLVDGLFHTGDVGYMDDEGYTFLIDRIKDMIICSGFNVYPRNVEEAIYLHPAVEETTVIGVPDKKRGETVKAFVKVKPGHTLTEEELNDFLKNQLSPYEVPKMYEFRDILPKTMIGKLSKKELVSEEVAKLNNMNNSQGEDPSGEEDA